MTQKASQLETLFCLYSLFGISSKRFYLLRNISKLYYNYKS